jgi:GTP-binding protein
VQVEFKGSHPGPTAPPEPALPQFALLGRSNCGKSSLINMVLQRKALARISGQPGKTRLWNYFRVDERYDLVDLPGYGYARVSKEQRQRWWRQFQEFLDAEDGNLGVLHLLDVRNPPTEQDREVSSWLRDRDLPFAVVLTKIDKVGAPQRTARYRRIIGDLALPPTTPLVPTSARERTGRGEVLGWIDAVLTAADHGV